MSTATLLAALPGSLLEIMDSSAKELIVLLFVSAVTGFALFVRQWLEWRRAAFESRINISLNTIADEVLRIRTLHEDDVKDVVLSPYARRLLKKAAKKTTLDNPFLSFANQNDAWMVYNGIVNTISGLYAAEMLSAAVHGKTKEEQFFVAITWERDAGTQIQKLRVIVVQLSVLRALFGSGRVIRSEVPNQASRIVTLSDMYRQYVRGEWPDHQIVSLPRM